MRYINLGCGYHYSTSNEWTNLDFISTGEGVIQHNLLDGIPFSSDYFDLVYHSHVLEHFSKKDAVSFLSDCYRILRPGGTIRVVVPDLEQIVRVYLHFLENGLNNLDNNLIKANYDWITLELFDQMVRNESGGGMAKYLFNDDLANEDFIFERIGDEGKTLREMYFKQKKSNQENNGNITFKQKIKQLLKKIYPGFHKPISQKRHYYDVGRFRYQGEIHQWMYDRYSLFYALSDVGFQKIEVKNAFTSNITNWAMYNLDGNLDKVRKPDSLFIEGIK